MKKFVIGRKYGNGRSFYTVFNREGGSVVLQHKGTPAKLEQYEIIIVDGVETCFPTGREKPLAATSVMGKPYQTTKEGGRIRRNKKQNAWNRANYDRLEIDMPKGMGARIEEAVKLEKTSKRKYVVEAIDDKLKKSGVPDFNSITNPLVKKFD